MRNFLYLNLIALTIGQAGYAGLFELSAQTSMKNTNIDENNSSESKSMSASVAYYFWQSGALEFTYMTGFNFTRGRIDATTDYEQVLNYNYMGVDLVYNLGKRESMFNPYVKAGLAEIKKELEYKQVGTGQITIQSPDGNKNLTYGLGFKLKLSKTLSFRFSYDVWQGPIDRSDATSQVDRSMKVGFSWLL